MKKDAKLTNQILKFRNISTSRTMLEILIDWMKIISLLAFFFWLPVWWVFPVVFILVGACQYNLLVLLHDAQHTLLNAQHKINDRIAIWTLAAPFGVTFSKSRMIHIKHHQHVGLSENDPDFPLYCTGEPAPKNTLNKFKLYFLRQIFMGRVCRVLLGTLKEKENIQIHKSNKIELFAVVVCQAVIFFSFTIAGYWHAYFYLWILPLLTVASFLNEARIFSEHSNPQDEKHKDKGLLISYISNPIERFFFGPHHMNYHAEHHLFPFIPHYYLPKVRQILQSNPEYHDIIQWRPSYLAHIKAYANSLHLTSEDNLTHEGI